MNWWQRVEVSCRAEMRGDIGQVIGVCGSPPSTWPQAQALQCRPCRERQAALVASRQTCPLAPLPSGVPSANPGWLERLSDEDVELDFTTDF